MANITLHFDVVSQEMKYQSVRTPIVAGSSNLYYLEFELGFLLHQLYLTQ